MWRHLAFFYGCALSGLRSLRSRYWHPIDDFVDDHLHGHTMAGGMRPEPNAVAENVLCKVLHVLRVNLGTAPPQQRPHFDQTSPADRRARRGSEIHALLDKVGWRPA